MPIMVTAIIAACHASTYGIGNNNSLPWHVPEDLAWFQQLTKNSVVIMGAKTWMSLPESRRPLPHRVNIVVSAVTLNPNGGASGPIIAKSFNDAIRISESFINHDVYIIGGASIYAQAINHPKCTKLYLTQLTFSNATLTDPCMHTCFDTFFPLLNPEQWIQDPQMSMDIKNFTKGARECPYHGKQSLLSGIVQTYVRNSAPTDSSVIAALTCS